MKNLNLISLIGWLAIFVILCLLVYGVFFKQKAITSSNYVAQVEQKNVQLEAKVDSLVYIIDSIIGNKRNTDSVIIVMNQKITNLNLKLYEKRNRIINDPDSVVPFVKNFLSGYTARQY